MDFAWFLFSFEGRINRAKYWLSGLVILFCWIIFLGILVSTAAKIFSYSAPASFSLSTDNIFSLVDPATFRFAIDKFRNGELMSAQTLIPALFYTITTPLFLWVYAATSIKRLHDRNKSGWWMVPFFVVPGLYGQFADRLNDSYTGAFLGLTVFILAIWGFIEMLCLRGTRGPNRFGPDPLAPREPRWDQQSELQFVPHRAGPPAGA